MLPPYSRTLTRSFHTLSVHASVTVFLLVIAAEFLSSGRLVQMITVAGQIFDSNYKTYKLNKV